MSQIRLRFAPSPTGYLHAGNARVAALNFLFAEQQGGEFWLRLDDTDKARSEKAFEKAIEEDLAWLGLVWSKKLHQSERGSLYEAAATRLREQGRLYPCYETAEELALARRLLLRSRRPPVYDRASLDPQRRRAFESEGRKPHWRFKLEHRALVLHDLFRGESRFDFASLSDPVLMREDGQALFTLTSVVDDGECSISHIVRGEDHATNSAVQAQLFQALGYRIPDMAHVPLLRGGDDSPLSKREGEGSLSLRVLRERGIEARALLFYLARLGSAKTARGDEDWNDLVKDFSFADFGRASPLFNLNQLREVNRRVVSRMAWEELGGRLAEGELSLLEGEDGVLFWELFRENCESVKTAGDWLRRCFAEEEKNDGIERVVPAREVASVVAEVLAEKEEITDWGDVLTKIERRVGYGGKKLYVALRMGLLGIERGPEVAGVMGLLGRERVKGRLCGG